MINGSGAAFQPFNSPVGTVNPLHNSNNNNNSNPATDQYLSPSNLRTPENDSLNALPTMSPFPAYHSNQPVPQSVAPDVANDKEDFKALDELTSRVGQVALGLDDEELKSDSNGQLSESRTGKA